MSNHIRHIQAAEGERINGVMKNKLLQIIQEYNQGTGGSCGISIVKLCEASGFKIYNVKSLLKEMHTDGKIKVREGINSKLIFPIPLAPKGGTTKLTNAK